MTLLKHWLRYAGAVGVGLPLCACAGTDPVPGGGSGTGGTGGTNAQGGGGASAAGGASATGGSTPMGGTSTGAGTGGSGGTGVSTGGTAGSGATGDTGGKANTGGTSGGMGPQAGGAARGASGRGNGGGGMSAGASSMGGSSTGGMSGTSGSAGSSAAGAGGMSAGCGSANTTSMCGAKCTTCSMDIAGTMLTYYVQLPSNYNPATPYRLIFQFHPSGGSADQALTMYQLNSKIPDAIYVTPQGLPAGDQGSPGWANTDGVDIEFTKGMLADVQGKYCVD